MLSVETINNLIGVDESFKASFKLAETLKSSVERELLFDSFLEIESDLSFDWFTEYYQSEHSDRKNDMQDFTPDSVVGVTTTLLGDTGSNLDMCAGTGGLTIKVWSQNPDACFYAEEYSERAFPFLLFNLAIRNVDGHALRGDALTRDFKESYQLVRGEKYSDIIVVDPPAGEVESVIMNPPYSQKWAPDKSWLNERRFSKFGALPPKSKADFAFVLTAFDKLADGGKLVAILPHGVLFRGSSEEIIRRGLIEQNHLDAVIGLPSNLFIATAIPTVILVLKKNRTKKDVLFIEASEEFEKDGKWNVIRTEHAEKIITTYQHRLEVRRFSHLADLEEIKDNDFNLNIPRYVDTFVPEPVPPLEDSLAELKQINAEINVTSYELGKMVEQLTTKDESVMANLKEMANIFIDRGKSYDIKKLEKLIAKPETEIKAKKEDPEVINKPKKGGQISFYDHI